MNLSCRIPSLGAASSLLGMALAAMASLASLACAGAVGDAASPDALRRAPCGSHAQCPSPPLVLPRGPFRQWGTSFKRVAGAPRHRARDIITRPGAPTFVIAKFAYGFFDADLSDEDVAVHLLRGCRGAWESVGVFRTTGRGTPPPASEPGIDEALSEVPDTGGRVYVNLAHHALAVGMHRVRFTVLGDGTQADALVDVLPPGAQVVVSDVDGTLTESEFASYRDVMGSTPPAANPGAATALSTLSGRGYHLVYLTARPDWFIPRTRTWLENEGFPLGVLRTSLGGQFGSGAAAFKLHELAAMRDKLLVVPAFAFGNMPSDVRAYAAAGVAPSRAFFFRPQIPPAFGIAHSDYGLLARRFSRLPPVCGAGEPPAPPLLSSP